MASKKKTIREFEKNMEVANTHKAEIQVEGNILNLGVDEVDTEKLL